MFNSRLLQSGFMGQPMPFQTPTPEMPQKQGLFGMPKQDMRNLMIAAGTAMSSRNPGAFGQILMGLQQQQQGHRSRKAMGNMTSKWLRTQGRNDLADAIDRGEIGGKQAMEFYKGTTEKAEKPTSLIQNFEYAKKNGFQGNFADWKAAGRQSTTINNMGNIPAGYERFESPETGAVQMRPIPGSPDYVKAEQLKDKSALGQKNKATAGTVVVQDIDRALQKIEGGKTDFLGINTTTGLVGSTLSNLPGTEAHDTGKLIETVEANTGFDKLQAMRDASPTGGALGQVSERELMFLKAAIGNLQLSQDDEQLADNLKRVKNIYLDIIHGEGQGPQRESLGFEKSQPEQNSGWTIRRKN